MAWEIGDIKPWNKNAAALMTTPICSGTAGAVVVPGTERRIGVTLASSAHWELVQVGDLITRNPSWLGDDRPGGAAQWATVIGKKPASTIVYLDRDVYTGSFAYSVYRPLVPTGWLELTGPLLSPIYALTPGRVTTGMAMDKLIDSGGDFVAQGVGVGDPAFNVRTGLGTVVTAIDSATQLSIQWHAFATTGDSYVIYSRQIVIPSGPLSGRLLFEMNRRGIYVGAGVTAGDAVWDTIQQHAHDHQPHVNFFWRGSPGAHSVQTGATPLDNNTPITIGGAIQVLGSGIPRAGEQTRPRTLRQPYIMRIE